MHLLEQETYNKPCTVYRRIILDNILLIYPPGYYLFRKYKYNSGSDTIIRTGIRSEMEPWTYVKTYRL
jgi:hypothetical protein